MLSNKFVTSKVSKKKEYCNLIQIWFEAFCLISWIVIIILVVNAIVVWTSIAPQPMVITETEYIECQDWGCEILREPVTIEIDGHSEFTNKMASYAYRISWNNLDFVLTLHSENWMRDVYRVWWPNVNWTYDHGLCQLNDWVSTNRIFMTSPERHSGIDQIQFCWSKYQWATFNSWDPWTLFRAYYIRNENRKLISLVWESERNHSSAE